MQAARGEEDPRHRVGNDLLRIPSSLTLAVSADPTDPRDTGFADVAWTSSAARASNSLTLAVFTDPTDPRDTRSPHAAESAQPTGNPFVIAFAVFTDPTDPCDPGPSGYPSALVPLR